MSVTLSKALLAHIRNEVKALIAAWQWSGNLRSCIMPNSEQFIPAPTAFCILELQEQAAYAKESKIHQTMLILCTDGTSNHHFTFLYKTFLYYDPIISIYREYLCFYTISMRLFLTQFFKHTKFITFSQVSSSHFKLLENNFMQCCRFL